MQCGLLQFHFCLSNGILHSLVDFLLKSLQHSNCIIVICSCLLAGKLQRFFLGLIVCNTIPVVFQCGFCPIQIPLGPVNCRLSLRYCIVVIFFCLGLLIFPLFLGIGILCIGIPDRKLLLFHILFLLQNCFIQEIQIQDKQDISLFYLLAFIDADTADPQTANCSNRKLLVLYGFTINLHRMIDGSNRGHLYLHHSCAMLINGS